MAAVSALMWDMLIHGDLPPVGGRVLVRRSPPPDFSGYSTWWLDSGTSALALAMLCARNARSHITAPEVVLPGYGCPDLVAAAEYAGVKPVLADIGTDDPGYDLDSLQAALTPQTVAVVAVNFLGIADRLQAIRRLLDNDHSDAALIEDNAQWYPEKGSEGVRGGDDVVQGDYACLSFGRGKPVSLLGGGALLVRSDLNAMAQKTVQQALADGNPSHPSLGAGPVYTAKVGLFNLLLQRHLYALATRNPWVSVGETYFEALEAIRSLGDRSDLIAANAQRYLSRSRSRERALSRVVDGAPGVIDLAKRLDRRTGRLLRLPVLCASEADQARLMQIGQRAGLGITAMYRKPLPEIAGVAERVLRSMPLPGATVFAQRLLTLPVHEGVRDADMDRFRTLFGR